MSIDGNRLLSNAVQERKAKSFHDGLRPESGRRRLELVGTIECPGQTRSSMSWSSDGRYLATSTGETVSVWRLPEKDLNHANKNLDARFTMSEEEETKKVGRNVEGLWLLDRLQVDCVVWERQRGQLIIQSNHPIS